MMQGVDSEAAPLRTEPMAQHPGRDERLFRDLLARFAALAETSFRFSREVYTQSGTPPEADLEGTIARNLTIARKVFGEGLLEILGVVYLRKSALIEEIRRSLDTHAARHLDRKLASLEEAGLVQRESRFDQVDETRYSLTHKGMIIARLGEPIFLYLRMAEGWSTPLPQAHAANRARE